MKDPVENYILATGDFLLSHTNPLIEDRIYQLMKDAEFSLINLEAPIINHEFKSKNPSSLLKKILIMFGREEQISSNEEDFLKFPIGKNIIWGLANNHILDYGQEGLENTIKALKKKAGYSFLGFNIDNFYVIREVNGRKALIFNMNFVNPEFKGLTLNITNRTIFRSGPYSLSMKLRERLKEEVQKVDVIIGFIHFGRVRTTEIRQKDIRIFRDLNGSINNQKKPFLILGHHSHQSGKIYFNKGENTLIVGSLGNFVFASKIGKYNESYHYNYISQIYFSKNRIEVKLIPIWVDDSCVRIIDELDKYPIEKYKYKLDYIP